MQPNACTVRTMRNDMAQAGSGAQHPRRRNGLPPEILEIMWPALQVGGASGTSCYSYSLEDLFVNSVALPA